MMDLTQYTFTVSPSDDPEEPWTARVNELPGCMSHGKYPYHALEFIGDAIESYLLSKEAVECQ